MCWRIVRVVGDGSIKLVLYNYSSSSCTTTGTSRAFARYTGSTYETQFNSSYNRNAYVGFMYGSGSLYAQHHANITLSTILTNLVKWYNLNNKFDDYEHLLADTIWCNDKSHTSGTATSTSNTIYSARARLYTVAQAAPTLVCPNDSEGGNLSKFTVNDEVNGNGVLDKRIGLLTADEVAFAGNTFIGNDVTYYLRKNATSTGWWLLSPSSYSGGAEGSVYVCTVADSYQIGFDPVHFSTSALRPAVSLKSTTTISEGDGKASTPYLVN